MVFVNAKIELQRRRVNDSDPVNTPITNYPMPGKTKNVILTAVFRATENYAIDDDGCQPIPGFHIVRFYFLIRSEEKSTRIKSRSRYLVARISFMF